MRRTRQPVLPMRALIFRKTILQSTRPLTGRFTAGRNGWAVGGAPSVQRHTATFKLEDPIVSTNGVTVRFNLQQHYGENLLLGRFRLYVTTSEDPLDFGMPDPVVQAARAEAGHRKPEQAAAIIDYYRSIDAEFWEAAPGHRHCQ